MSNQRSYSVPAACLAEVPKNPRWCLRCIGLYSGQWKSVDQSKPGEDVDIDFVCPHSQQTDEHGGDCSKCKFFGLQCLTIPDTKRELARNVIALSRNLLKHKQQYSQKRPRQSGQRALCLMFRTLKEATQDYHHGLWDTPDPTREARRLTIREWIQSLPASYLEQPAPFNEAIDRCPEPSVPFAEAISRDTAIREWSMADRQPTRGIAPALMAVVNATKDRDQAQARRDAAVTQAFADGYLCKSYVDEYWASGVLRNLLVEGYDKAAQAHRAIRQATTALRNASAKQREAARECQEAFVDLKASRRRGSWEDELLNLVEDKMLESYPV